MTVLWRAHRPDRARLHEHVAADAALYWGGFGLVARTAARHAGWLGIATMVLAFTPPAFFFAGLIWRDILFADVWLFAAALTYATASRPAAIRWPAQTIAMLLVGLGVLLRPNAIIAAPLLAAYVMWPAAFHWKRVALILIPGIVAGYALIHTVYYTALNAERLYPLHSRVRLRPRRYHLLFGREPVSGGIHARRRPRCFSPNATTRTAGTITGTSRRAIS